MWFLYCRRNTNFWVCYDMAAWMKVLTVGWTTLNKRWNCQLRACVVQCATKRRRRKIPMIAAALPVEACTVNVHKKLLTVNQAVVTRFLWLCGGFSHAGRSSLSLECRHTELRGFSRCWTFCFWGTIFTAFLPRNMWSSESNYSTVPALGPFPGFPGSSSLVAMALLYYKCWKGAADFWPRNGNTSQTGVTRLRQVFISVVFIWKTDTDDPVPLLKQSYIRWITRIFLCLFS